MVDIFISYSSEDRKWVKRLVHRLKKFGYNVWWDRELRAGKDFHNEIQQALDSAKCVIAVWSKNSVESKWVREESRQALDENKLVPISVEDTRIPMPFGSIQKEDMGNWKGDINAIEFQRLIQAINEILQKAPPIPVPANEGLPYKYQKLIKITLISISLISALIFTPKIYRIIFPEEKNIASPGNIYEAPVPPRTEEKIKIASPEIISFKVNNKNFSLTVQPIPDGEFTMGCPWYNKKCREDEKPAHPVKLSPFSMSITEVTVEQYLLCVEDKACNEPRWREEGHEANVETGNNRHYKVLGKDLIEPNHPIVGISWQDAKKFTKWLSNKTNSIFRLPTEAEWEYAAKAKSNYTYSWGDDLGDSKANCQNSDCGDSFINTSPVKSFPPNNFGLYDMHGNILELCEDRYGKYSNKAEANPKGAATGRFRVARGGSYYSLGHQLASTRRVPVDSLYHDSEVGFRVVKVIDK